MLLIDRQSSPLSHSFQNSRLTSKHQTSEKTLSQVTRLIKMKAIIVLSLAILLLAPIFINQALCAAFSDIESASNPAKRSLCNTFGGCGAKRSLTQPASFMDSSSGSPRVDATNEIGSWLQRPRDSDANSISEILSDLIEFLRTDEKYKHGKYVVFVPKHHNKIPSSLSNGDINASDLQELQIGRIYSGKSE